MNNINELFPFPDADENQPAASGDAAEKNLPDFPSTSGPTEGQTVGPLTNDEISQVRTILTLFKKGELTTETATQPETNQKPEPSIFATIPEPEQPAVPIAPVIQGHSVDEIKQKAIQIFDRSECSEAFETETKNELKTILQSIAELEVFLQVYAGLNSVFPLKMTLRHATPEQRLFALITFGDKFLKGIKGLVFAQRRQLLKAVGRYLSQVSEGFSFIQMEGETFSPQYHERVAEASTSGRTVREMHGYLVVGKQNNNVVRIGMVLT